MYTKYCVDLTFGLFWFLCFSFFHFFFATRCMAYLIDPLCYLQSFFILLLWWCLMWFQSTTSFLFCFWVSEKHWQYSFIFVLERLYSLHSNFWYIDLAVFSSFPVFEMCPWLGLGWVLNVMLWYCEIDIKYINVMSLWSPPN